MKRYGRSGWYGESNRHYLAAKGVKTKRYDAKKTSAKTNGRYDTNKDLASFKAKWKDRTVTKEDFRKQSKKAAKIAILGIDEDRGFRPMELIIPSSKNEAEVAKAIFLGAKLRKQNKAKLAKAKTPEERERIKKEIKENDKFRSRLKEKKE